MNYRESLTLIDGAGWRPTAGALAAATSRAGSGDLG